jgi:hypothetical protein
MQRMLSRLVRTLPVVIGVTTLTVRSTPVPTLDNRRRAVIEGYNLATGHCSLRRRDGGRKGHQLASERRGTRSEGLRGRNNLRG